MPEIDVLTGLVMVAALGLGVFIGASQAIAWQRNQAAEWEERYWELRRKSGSGRLELWVWVRDDVTRPGLAALAELLADDLRTPGLSARVLATLQYAAELQRRGERLSVRQRGELSKTEYMRLRNRLEELGYCVARENPNDPLDWTVKGIALLGAVMAPLFVEEREVESTVGAAGPVGERGRALGPVFSETH